MLPPAYLPKTIKTQEDIGNWVESNILKNLPKDYEYCISFVALVDLKKFFAKKNLLPNVKYRVQWRTIWDSLAIDEVYPPEYAEKYIKENISLADIIRISDITFLASKACSDSELEKIENDRENLISKLKEIIGTSKLTLSDYSKMDKGDLATVLSKYVSDPNQVAESIITEAAFWEDFLKEKGQFNWEVVA